MTGLPPLLVDELQAIVTGLRHARRTLDDGKLAEMGEFSLRLEQCASRISSLSPNERDDISPVLLALLDELERTFAAFDKESRDLGDKLRSANRRIAADAAYQMGVTR